jgi:hypothetical protein
MQPAALSRLRRFHYRRAGRSSEHKYTSIALAETTIGLFQNRSRRTGKPVSHRAASRLFLMCRWVMETERADARVTGAEPAWAAAARQLTTLGCLQGNV